MTTRKGRMALLAVFALVAFILSASKLLTVSTAPEEVSASACHPKAAVTQWLTEMGFEENQFKVSLKGFEPRKGSEAWEAGSDAFASRPIHNVDQLEELLGATTGRAGKAAEIIKIHLNGREVIPVAVMFPNGVNIEGNLGVRSGNVVQLGTRKSDKFDIVWVFVDKADCQVVGGIVLRGACGNPGKTVAPPVKKPHNPTPTDSSSPTPSATPTCPPGQNMNPNGVCVTPKSNNPNDYSYPEGKPPVTVTTPAEATPAPVATAVTGGRGVVDSAVRPPGSESGVTAPGAVPAPTSAPSLPPNEGGTNSGTTPGF